MGVRLVDLGEDVELLAIDKNVEDEGEEEATAVAKGEKTMEEAQEATSSAHGHENSSTQSADGQGSELGVSGERWEDDDPIETGITDASGEGDAEANVDYDPEDDDEE